MMREWKGPQTLIVGHENTSVMDPEMVGYPIIKEHFVALDTGAHKNGTLSAIRFPDRKVFQSRKAKL